MFPRRSICVGMRPQRYPFHMMGCRSVPLLALTCCAPAFCADWPQWRGPHRDGISAETGLLDSWPAGGPRLVWKTQGLGEGYSAFAVVGDRLFTQGQAGLPGVRDCLRHEYRKAALEDAQRARLQRAARQRAARNAHRGRQLAFTPWPPTARSSASTLPPDSASGA